MIKNQTILEHKIGERLYQLILDPVSPLGEVFDALCHMKSYVLQKMQESNKQAEPEEESQVDEDESKE